MTFLKKAKVPVQLTIIGQIEAGKEAQVQDDLTTILANLTPAELSIVRKISQKPAIKTLALTHAQKFI